MRTQLLCFAAWLAMVPGAAAEIHHLTLEEAVELALRQNPDLMMARLDEQTARHQIRVARDPFIPKVFVGSGLAYNSGFPMSIEGAAPSVVQARAVASILNRPQRHRLAQTRELARSAEIATESKRNEIALRTVELYLEAARAASQARLARLQVETLERVAGVMRVRASAGRELPVALKRAELDVVRARRRAESFEANLADAEANLALLLGFGPEDRVRAASEERARPDLPDSEGTAVRMALEKNTEIRRLESRLLAKGYEVKAEKAAGLPRVRLVAQYGLFSKFNNYEDFFRRFERHNAQFGVAFELPLYTGSAARARAAQAELEVTRLRAELEATRNRLVLDARQAFHEVQQAESALELSRLDLEVARDDLGVLLARMEEGRASIKDVEAARYFENEKWIAYYDALHAVELARYRLLHETGRLVAALTQ